MAPLISMLMKKYPTIFIKSLSHTTREPRKNEKEGINYIFISKEKFLELDKNKEFLLVFEKYNNFYGTSKQMFNNYLYNDNIVLCDFNIETAIEVFNKKEIEFNYIAFLPPNIEELENRIIKRGGENQENIQKRIDFAKIEIELIKKSKFLNYVIINDNLDKAFNEFELCIKNLYPDLFI